MSAPDIAPEDAALVSEVLRTHTLSGGRMVDAFEREWCARFGVAHAIAVSSGTAGLHLAVIAAGVGAGDLVLTSPFSFVASANVALYERAIPVFVDVDPHTLAMDPAAVAETLEDLAHGGPRARRRLPPSLAGAAVGPVKALLPVHVFGRPADVPALSRLAQGHGAALIEDACEAPGATIGGRYAGTLGHAGVFGFYPNKQLTTGEGGMVCTSDADWAHDMRSRRNQGRDDDATWLRHVRLGYNYRLDEMSAALGLAQLRRLDTLLDRRRRVARAYSALLDGVDGLRTPDAAGGRDGGTGDGTSWFVYVVRLDPDVDRDAVIAALAADGIPSRPYFPPIHLQPLYREQFGYRPGDFPVAEAAARSVLALPFHAHLTDEQIAFIVSRLTAAVRACGRSSSGTVVSAGART